MHEADSSVPQTWVPQKKARDTWKRRTSQATTGQSGVQGHRGLA
jgi:hypothetical protein